MTRRSYDQYCGLAKGLDLIGERWTLLIVRELMTGPKRYTDLAAALQGIGTSLLAERLKQLESDGIIERDRLPPPAASTVYQLTGVGQELVEAMMPLAMWGMRHAVPTEPAESDKVSAEWVVIGLMQLLDADALAGVTATIAFDVDGDTALLRIVDGSVEVQLAGSATPVATIRASAATMAGIGSGRSALSDELAAGTIEIDGDVESLGALATSLASALS